MESDERNLNMNENIVGFHMFNTNTNTNTEISLYNAHIKE